MKIVVIGLRGFPNIQGGIETHCEELYPRIVCDDFDITVTRRRNFVHEKPPLTSYQSIHFKDIKAPAIIGFEAAIHSLRGVWYAWRHKADVVHIHAIGPSLAIPLAKLLGLKVIMTHHGPDYDREKWGFFAKWVLRMGERFAARQADEIIAISTVITEILRRKYNRTEHVHLIFNGITTFTSARSENYIKKLGLKPGKYILAVARFVEEKRLDNLIEAYIQLKDPEMRLVIAGNADYETSYCCFLREFAMKNQVILTGIVKGENLKELYMNAGLFVLPSSHEGMPITLLEAMSFGRKVLASDIPAHIAIDLPKDNYFRLNNMDDFVRKIRSLLYNGQEGQTYDLTPYNWDHIALQTKKVYQDILQKLR